MRLLVLNHPMAWGSSRWFRVVRPDGNNVVTTAAEIVKPFGVKPNDIDGLYTRSGDSTVFNVNVIGGDYNSGFINDNQASAGRICDISICNLFDYCVTEAIVKLLDAEEQLAADFQQTLVGPVDHSEPK